MYLFKVANNEFAKVVTSCNPKSSFDGTSAQKWLTVLDGLNRLDDGRYGLGEYLVDRYIIYSWMRPFIAPSAVKCVDNYMYPNLLNVEKLAVGTDIISPDEFNLISERLMAELWVKNKSVIDFRDFHKTKLFEANLYDQIMVSGKVQASYDYSTFPLDVKGASHFLGKDVFNMEFSITEFFRRVVRNMNS